MQSVAQNNIYIAIIGAFVFVVLVSFIIYNMVSIHNLNKDSEEQNKKQLLSIGLNKHDLNMLKQYVNEEDLYIKNSIHNNKQSSKTNKETIEKNKKELEDTVALFNKNKDELHEINKQVILNKTRHSTAETAFDAYKKNQAATLDRIVQKQNTIQTNIGEFKYSDFNVVRDSVNSNNVKINNLNTGLGNLTGDVTNNAEALDLLNNNVAFIDEEMESMNKMFLKKNNLQNELDIFYNDTILPKYTDMNDEIQGIDIKVNENVQSISDINDEMYTINTQVQGLESSINSNLEFIEGNIASLETNIDSMSEQQLQQQNITDTVRSDITQIQGTIQNEMANNNTRFLSIDNRVMDNKTIIDGIMSSGSSVQEEF